MNMEFESRKTAALAVMASAERDKSPKGTLDAPIIPLLKALNLNPSYFTTSSCSGRISILSQPHNITNNKKKARGGSWLFITHEPADPDSVIDLLFRVDSSTTTQDGNLVLRFEPFIVAVECKDVSSAQSLVSTAISCGFRESGITSVHKRIIIAIRCSIRLEVPLGEMGRVMVSPDYVRYLIEIANEKMEINRRRTDGFLQALQCNGLAESAIANPESEVLSGEAVHESNTPNPTDEKYPEWVEHVCDNSQDEGAANLEVANSHNQSELLRVPIVKLLIVGEPFEKLFRWGHSACTLSNTNHGKILIFGGFGSLGRHARKNDSLMLDPLCGKLESLNFQACPSARLGHTSSVVGDCVFVIGGRGDPLTILNDVWVLNTTKNEWRLLECTGSNFHPRHRHAAAVVGSKIYVFGGLNNETVCSSMQVLDTERSRWSEVCIQGEWPCARHSHSLVANESLLFMFGGYDGEQALAELYSFDVQTCLWKKEKNKGRTPYPRFSHSMFIYNNYLGIIGGCPVTQNYQELALLDLRLRVWKHVILTSVGKYLFVRSTANVVGNDLVIIGGGASCYAFGTKFTEPVKISLLPLTCSNYLFTPSDVEEMANIHRPEEAKEKNHNDFVGQRNNLADTLIENSILNTNTNILGECIDRHVGVKYWVLQLERKHAKLGKDILKKFGWLDLGRKVYSHQNGLHICLPVVEKFGALFHEKKHSFEYVYGGLDDLHPLRSFTGGISLNEFTCPTALNLLRALGGLLCTDNVVSVKKAPNSPQKKMNEAVGSLIKHKGLPQHLLEQLPTRWDRLGDIVVLPVTSFKDPIWDSIGEELWPTVAKSLGTHRLARQGRIAPTGTRDSTLDILVGDSGWVDHCENGILYSFNASKCMFSWGNLSEKLRMARLECRNEVIVDLFAGIGYFVLPFLVKAKAKLVYACEWNPNAVEALQHNVVANSVADRCVILEGDNRITAPKGVADRVCLGLLPSSEGSWLTAVRALRSEGGMLHVHGNVNDSEEEKWLEHVIKSIGEFAKSEGYCWEVSLQHLERVKWYAPHIRHLVADISCEEIPK